MQNFLFDILYKEPICVKSVLGILRTPKILINRYGPGFLTQTHYPKAHQKSNDLYPLLPMLVANWVMKLASWPLAKLAEIVKRSLK